jgi:hypothetical protein
MGSRSVVIRAALGASVATDRARTTQLHTGVFDGACDHHWGDASDYQRTSDGAWDRKL